MKHKIKGDIISWNSSIWDFNNKMRSVKEDEDIHLEINSYGGDVFLGIDIMNTLRSHKGHVEVTVTGIAASAASIICMGADKINMYSNTQMMLHNAWTFAMGNSKELRKVADDLESINESVLASYTHRLEKEVAIKLLDDETYLSASKAKEFGLIDAIVESKKAEEVESEVFQDKAEEFNAAIKKPPVAASVVVTLDGEVKDAIESMQKQINDFVNRKVEPTPEPDPQGRGSVNLFKKWR